ncbi:MAG: lysophospholipase [Lachnospiraceae bacterium]|nr:lysophospholipase [Lachnospiraceae bacterium]
MRIVLYAAIIILLLIITAILLISNKFADMIMHPDAHDEEFLLKEAYDYGRFTPEFIEGIRKEDFCVRSRYGYDLHGFIMNNDISVKPENSRKVAVLCHGYTSGKIVMTGYAALLNDLGFTCILYDHRGHGDNSRGVVTTMGFLEREDLKTILDYAYERFGSDARVITYGESMGSATVLSHLEIDDRPVLTIADCGYSDLTELCRYLVKDVYHLPVFPIVPLAALKIKLVGKFDIKDVSPKLGVIKAASPILFIHGDKDTFVPTYMSKDMVKLGKGVREIYLCPGAEHAQSAALHPDEYRKKVSEFIEKNYT